MSTNKEITIDYTNWKGNRRIRKILPLKIIFGKDEYHKDEQWLLQAWDLEDNSGLKNFSMNTIHSWTS